MSNVHMKPFSLMQKFCIKEKLLPRRKYNDKVLFCVSCHSRPPCPRSPLHPQSASLLVWCPAHLCCLAATAAASPPSAAAVYQKHLVLSCPWVTTLPTLCLLRPPCRTPSPVALTSPFAGRTRRRPLTACMKGTTPADLCHCPTVCPSPRRRTRLPCHLSPTSCAQAAWSWREPPTLESHGHGRCPERCHSYRCCSKVQVWESRIEAGKHTHWRNLHFSTGHSLVYSDFFFFLHSWTTPQ